MKFVSGVLFTILVVVGGGLAIALLGYAPVNANSAPPGWEKGIAARAVDAAIKRNAPNTANPVPPTDDNLAQGMVIYNMNCVVCHGSPVKKENPLGHSFYPPVPQFPEDPPDKPDNETYWIVKNGVRYTGMPAWDKTLSDDDMWKVTLFLGHWSNLPPAVKEKWEKGL